MARQQVSEVSAEFDGVALGDVRLEKRLKRVVAGLAKKPDASFPTAAGDEGQAEGLYRLFRNAKVTLWKLLRPHVTATVARCADAVGGVLVVIHDTTECAFHGESEREGLGRVSGGQGFFAHVALAVQLNAAAMPLGILGVETHFRHGKAKKRKTSAELRNTPPENRESWRWKKLVEKVRKVLGPRAQQAVHVMDREADDYLLLEMLQGDRFVIRARHERKVTANGGASFLDLGDWLKEKQGKLFREVPLSKRSHGSGNGHFGKSQKLSLNRRYPERSARMATLEYRAGTVALKRPVWLTGHTKMLTVNVVQVSEPRPPAGQERIEWTLLTSEPVSTASQVERVVDCYRARWLIEELFKALKTGCAYEKRQLESAHALMNALGVFLPIAWSLLRMRSVARLAPDAPANTVLTELQLKLLPHLIKKSLPKDLTAGAAMLALAAYAGHFKHNGPPGWQILARGFHDLLGAEIGYGIAKAEM